MIMSSSNTHAQGFGVYRFEKKYGANVDGYSPIYTPDSWAETGSQYSLGVKGLLAWYACLPSSCIGESTPQAAKVLCAACCIALCLL